MTLMLLTVEVDVDTVDEARARGTAAGFTVRRVTQPKETLGATTAPSVFFRANAVIDRPAGLNALERKAYNRGYAAACLTYVKKHGIPRGDTYREVVKRTKEAEWDRHPAAHKKGMAELAAYRLAWGHKDAQEVAA